MRAGLNRFLVAMGKPDENSTFSQRISYYQLILGIVFLLLMIVVGLTGILYTYLSYCISIASYWLPFSVFMIFALWWALAEAWGHFHWLFIRPFTKPLNINSPA